jgi:hypothetical protein
VPRNVSIPVSAAWFSLSFRPWAFSYLAGSAQVDAAASSETTR